MTEGISQKKIAVVTMECISQRNKVGLMTKPFANVRGWKQKCCYTNESYESGRRGEGGGHEGEAGVVGAGADE